MQMNSEHTIDTPIYPPHGCNMECLLYFVDDWRYYDMTSLPYTSKYLIGNATEPHYNHSMAPREINKNVLHCLTTPKAIVILREQFAGFID